MAYNPSKLNEYRHQLVGHLCTSEAGGGPSFDAADVKERYGTGASTKNISTSAPSSSSPFPALFPIQREDCSGRFVCPTCPYCSGARDPTVKFIHPSTKPGTREDFWNHVVLNKYRNVQSRVGKENMASSFPPVSSSCIETRDGEKESVEGEVHNNDKMFVLGPMVDQSELPFRLLCREYGATLTYTPMLNAKCFTTSHTYRQQFLSTTPLEEVVKMSGQRPIHPDDNKSRDKGSQVDEGERWPSSQLCAKTECKVMESGSAVDKGKTTKPPHLGSEVGEEVRVDRPVFVQFCGADADTILEGARLAVRGAHCCKKLRWTPPLPSTTPTTTTPFSSSTAHDHHHNSSSSSDSTKSSSHHLPPSSLAAASLVDNNRQKYGEEEWWYLEGNGERYYHCDAVDINLGCPQGIARRGHYGSFLMEEWDTIHTIIHTLHCELEVPVTAKIRVFDEPNGQRMDKGLTLAYIKMILDAGASAICIHGRTREMKGQYSGLADMEFVHHLCDEVHKMTSQNKNILLPQGELSLPSTSSTTSIPSRTDDPNLHHNSHNSHKRAQARTMTLTTCFPPFPLCGKVPMITNGNVLCFADVVSHLSHAGVSGHMCAEPLLWNPSLFGKGDIPSGRLRGVQVIDSKQRWLGLHHAQRYLWYVRRWPAPLGMVKAHLFKILHWIYELYPEMRVTLSSLDASPIPGATSFCVFSSSSSPLPTSTSSSFFAESASSSGLSSYHRDVPPNSVALSHGTDNDNGSSTHKTGADESTPAAAAAARAYETALKAFEGHIAKLIEVEQQQQEEKESSTPVRKESERLERCKKNCMTECKEKNNQKEEGVEVVNGSTSGLPTGGYNWFAGDDEADMIHLFDTQ